MPSLARVLYSPRAFDTIFAIAALTSAGMIWFGAGHPVAAIAPPEEPWRKAAALIAVVLAGGVLAAFSTRLDQRMADDFVFQALAKSAFVGMFAFVFALVLWSVLLQDSLGDLPGFTVFCVAICGWTFGWFYTRWRGTRA